MASLDQNLVTTQWSILGAFGVAITLLLPKAETFRRDYLAAGEQADFDDARRPAAWPRCPIQRGEGRSGGRSGRSYRALCHALAAGRAGCGGAGRGTATA